MYHRDQVIKAGLGGKPLRTTTEQYQVLQSLHPQCLDVVWLHFQPVVAQLHSQQMYIKMLESIE
jgi:hypothetical protein